MDSRRGGWTIPVPNGEGRATRDRPAVGAEALKSRFFTPHPRTYPKELTLIGAPETFGAPFVQNDTAGFQGIAGVPGNA